MTEQARRTGYDAFGDAAAEPSSGRAGPSLPAIVALFWITAALLVGGRLYLEIGHGASGRHAALHSGSAAAPVR